MKKVKFLTNTAYHGPKQEGDVVTVPDDYADRWVKNGIAALIAEPDEEPEDITGPEAEAEEEVEVPEEVEEVEEPAVVGDAEEDLDAGPEPENIKLTDLTAKELYATCIERGIDVEAKKPKAYYLEKLA